VVQAAERRGAVVLKRRKVAKRVERGISTNVFVLYRTAGSGGAQEAAPEFTAVTARSWHSWHWQPGTGKTGKTGNGKRQPGS
jgi:hypothetical protein